MRLVGRIFPDQYGSKSVNLLVFLIVAVFLAYQAAQAILANDLTGLAFAAVLMACGVVVVVILKDWRKGLYLLVAWILFEDIVRKYLGNNMAIYFGKDALTLVVYLSFFRARRARKQGAFRVPFRLPLLIFIWFAALQIFNPASSSIFYGILGMKVDFLYLPLVYVAYALIQSEEDLYRFFSFLSVLILIVASLGLAQSIIGPTFLNPATLQEDIAKVGTTYRVAPISGLVAYRPTSVFVSAGRFMDFLIVSWVISLGYAGYLLLRSQRGRILAFVTIGVVAAASVMSASRGVFMWNSGVALLIIAGFLWGAPWRQREALRVFRAIQRTALIVGLGMVILVTLFPKELESRLQIYSETLLPSSPASELVQRTQTYPLKQLENAFSYPRWPYGYGLGVCTMGWQYVIRIMHAEYMGVGVESGYGNLLLELGIVGLILWIILGLAIAVSAWKVVSELRGTPWFPLSFVIFCFAVLLFFPMTFLGFTYQDFVVNSDLWLSLGILYRLRDWGKEIRLAVEQSVPRQA